MRHSTVQTRSLSHRHSLFGSWQSATHLAIAVAAFAFVGAVTLGIF
ncbi:hypothetical protein JZX87_21770 [Agrobacterium sp. Ap1]|nr:hypothetical protein [Agrobacterium sp. Ap1]MBO0143794.1 hypothetical protein [Agrobacterium sp. Ap1]